MKQRQWSQGAPDSMITKTVMRLANRDFEKFPIDNDWSNEDAEPRIVAAGRPYHPDDERKILDMLEKKNPENARHIREWIAQCISRLTKKEADEMLSRLGLP